MYGSQGLLLWLLVLLVAAALLFDLGLVMEEVQVVLLLLPLFSVAASSLNSHHLPCCFGFANLNFIEI